MSTKTTIKRIALVAVAALGLGVVSTVAANAAPVADDALAITAITAGTPGAVRAGQTVYVPITISAASSIFASGKKVNLKALGVSGPTGSNFLTSASAGVAGGVFTFGNSLTGSDTATATGVVNAYYQTGVPSILGATTKATLAPTTDGTAAAGRSITQLLTLSSAGTAASSVKVFFAFTPDIAGTYTFTVFNDSNDNNALSGSEVSSSLISVATANSPASATVTITGGSANATSANTAAVATITLKDSAGATTTLSGSEAITLTQSNAAMLIDGGSTAVNLTASSFNSGTPTSGVYYAALTTTATTTSTYNLVVASAGSISPAFSSTIPVTFTVATTGTGTSATVGVGTQTTGFTAPTTAVSVAASAPTPDGTIDNDGEWKLPAGSFTWTITDATDAGTTIPVVISDYQGGIFGQAGAGKSYSVQVALDATTGKGTFSVSAPNGSSSSATRGYTVKIGAGTAKFFGVSLVAATGSTGTMTPAVTTLTVAPAATVAIKYTLTDLYGKAVSGAAVSFTVSGRNTYALNGVTDAAGNVTVTYTDAGTTGTSDTITPSATWYTGGVATSSGTNTTTTISYDATYVVSTVKLTSDDYSTAGVANFNVSPQGIDASYKGASNTTRPITATVKTSTGVALVGIPVTFSVAGTGVAIPSNAVTAYTNASGVATSAVYAWLAGTYTITAKAGSVSGTATETFAQSNAAYVRTVTATASGNTITATVKDRYGNPVSGVTVYAIGSGGAYFGGYGATWTSLGTLGDGTATFVVDGNGSVKVTTVDPRLAVPTPVGQELAAKGYDSADTVNGNAFTAYVAGTTATAEKGVGSTFDAAGVSSATVDVSSTVSSDAVDAANEATDAANAATDAANAAAEAADAATAAAQDAQAAVAALATQVASLIAGIKAQITTLTNLVVKIQKKVKA